MKNVHSKSNPACVVEEQSDTFNSQGDVFLKALNGFVFTSLNNLVSPSIFKEFRRVSPVQGERLHFSIYF